MNRIRSIFSKKILILIILSLFSLSSLASPVAIALASISQLIQTATQAFLAIGLIAGYQVNIKPSFPSKAEAHLGLKILENASIKDILQATSTKTGIVIKPELVAQLDAAGMHHDFSKLGALLAHVESVPEAHRANLIQQIFEHKQAELNPYALVPGIKTFEQPDQYPNDSYAAPTLYPSATTQNTVASYTIDLSPQKQETQTTFIPQPITHYKEHNGEPLLTGNQQASAFANKAPSKTQQLILEQMSRKKTETQYYYNRSKVTSRLANQHRNFSDQADALADRELTRAKHSVLPHFQDQSLRTELQSYVNTYKTTLKDACQIGASAAIIKAQTKIATQGLPLPGFLREFSDVLQKKAAPLCFDKAGNWTGLENAQDLEKFKQATQAYNEMLSKLSIHLDFQNAHKAEQCIEDFYAMDQGQGSWAHRFCNWVGSFFNDELTHEELCSRILSNATNNQFFTTLDLFEKKEFSLARLPLEQMNTSCRTSNGALLHHKLLQQYQQEIQSHYGDCKIPLLYKNDPVYWLYRPSLAQMHHDDSNIKLIQSHLAIRDSVYQAIINKVSPAKAATSFVQHLSYGLIDKINDPIALIDHLQHLNSNSENPEIRQACSVFFDQGILKLFDLKKQAAMYGITIPDSIDLQQNTQVRSAVNKLLLVDAKTEQGKTSIQSALKYAPYACQQNEFSKEYQNIILATAQAHTQDHAPRGIVTIKALEHPTSESNINRVLIKAAGKAAEYDLGQIKLDSSSASPLTPAQAWTCIEQVQDLMQQGNESKARALAETYLQGFIDEQMPYKKQMAQVLGTTVAITAAGGGLWWATSGDQHKQLPKIVPQGPPQKSNLPDDEDKNKKDKNKPNYAELAGLIEKAKKDKPRLLENGFNINNLEQIIDLAYQIKGGKELIEKLINSIRNEKTGSESNAIGIWHELRTMKRVSDSGRTIIEVNAKRGGREIDIITTDAFIECKSSKWNNTSMEEVLNQLGQQKKLALSEHKSPELHSLESIPDSLKKWLNKKNIKIFEG